MARAGANFRISASFYKTSRCFWDGIEGYNTTTALPLTLPKEFACSHPSVAGPPEVIAATGSVIILNFNILLHFQKGSGNDFPSQIA